MVASTDTSCAFCVAVEESINHLFDSCNQISHVWYKVSRWLRNKYVSPNIILQVFESFYRFGVG
jgi:hypothetical protein